MADPKKELLDDIKKMDGVEKVALISRTGMFIEGDEFGESDTFSAMSAIILGASETASMGLGTIKKVIVHFDDGNQFIVVPVGRKGVLVILANKDVYEDVEKLKKDFDEII